MSERYYTQMAEKFGMSPRELSDALKDESKREQLEKKMESARMATYGDKKRPTKRDISKKIAADLGVEMDISKATVAALDAVVTAIKTKKVNKVDMPEGRLKAPYLAALGAMLSIKEDNFDAVNVAQMKNLIQALNNL